MKTNDELPASKVPLLVKFLPMVNVRAPAWRMDPPWMVRSWLRVQFEVGEIPEACVLATETELSAAGVPANVIAPVPARLTNPVLVNPVPKSTVAAALGAKFRMPLLVTVPELVNDPRIECVNAPPLNVAPAPTVILEPIVQPTLGLTPPVLLTVKCPNTGADVELRVGGTEPLNSTYKA